MTIWVMNLKDNRSESEKADGKSKFDFCLEKKILGIGWGNEADLPDEEKSPEHLKALNALNKIKSGDLIWINGGEDFYIAAADGDLKKAPEEWHKYDIAHYIDCTYYKIGKEIPDELSEYKDKLAAYSTIQEKPFDELFYEKCNEVYEKLLKKSNDSNKKTEPMIFALVVIAAVIVIAAIIGGIMSEKSRGNTEINSTAAVSSGAGEVSGKNGSEEITSDISSGEVSDAASSSEKRYPTLEEYLSCVKTRFRESFNGTEISQGTITDGKYQFFIANLIETKLILSDNNEVINAFFTSGGKSEDFAKDIALAVPIGVALMEPLCKYGETEYFDMEEVQKDIYNKILEQVKETGYTGTINFAYSFGDCNFMLNYITSENRATMGVITGYKKD